MGLYSLSSDLNFGTRCSRWAIVLFLVRSKGFRISGPHQGNVASALELMANEIFQKAITRQVQTHDSRDPNSPK